MTPRLPGTMLGLIEAGATLYRDLEDADNLVRETVASLAAVERALRRGDDVRPLLFEVSSTIRIADAGRRRLAETLRRYADAGRAS